MEVRRMPFDEAVRVGVAMRRAGLSVNAVGGVWAHLEFAWWGAGWAQRPAMFGVLSTADRCAVGISPACGWLDDRIALLKLDLLIVVVGGSLG